MQRDMSCQVICFSLASGLYCCPPWSAVYRHDIISLMAKTTTTHVGTFYSSPASMLTDSKVLAIVSTFLQCTQAELVEALLLRQAPLDTQWNRTIGQWYYHYPKKEKKKSRYITEPLPVLRNLQEKILFMIQGAHERQMSMKDELAWYAHLQWYWADQLLPLRSRPWAGFYETPEEKTRLHIRHTPSPYFIHLDIAKAFPSLSEAKVYTTLLHIFRDQRNIKPFHLLETREFQKAIVIMAHLLSYDQHLATGSPASPYLFHTTLAHLDKQIFDALDSLPLEWVTYSRYLDDIIISFSRILSPTLSELSRTTSELHELYTILQKKSEEEAVACLFAPELLGLPLLLKRINVFFHTDTIQHSDTWTKKTIRLYLSDLRTLLASYKSVFTDLLQNEFTAPLSSDTPQLNHEHQVLFHKLYQSIFYFGQSISKSIHTTIGNLDRYKRMNDASASDYGVTMETVNGIVQELIQHDGRTINKEKIDSRYPDSPTIKKMLWLGITKDGKITIPRNTIAAKIAFYHDILSGKEEPPRHLRHGETWGLDYRKIFTSIQWYKEYVIKIKRPDASLPKGRIMRHMKDVFSKKEREEFRKIENLCAQYFNIPLEDAFKIFFAPKEEQPRSKAQSDHGNEKDAPVDERFIPREDAPYNQPGQPVYTQHGILGETVKQTYTYSPGWNDPSIDDLPF